MISSVSRRLLQKSVQVVSKPSLMRQVTPAVVHTFSTTTTTLQQVSSFHTTSFSLAKKEKKGKKDVDESDVDVPAVTLPQLSKYDNMMEATITWFTNELSKIQSASRITVDFFNNLSVETYGNIGRAGQVTLSPGGGANSAGKLSIHLYDPDIAPAVMNAIKNCGLGVNPTQDGSTISGSIPKASKETRDALLKNISKMAEKVSRKKIIF